MIYTGLAAVFSVGVFYMLPYVLPLDSLPSMVSIILDAFYVYFTNNVYVGIIGFILLGMFSSFIASWKYINKTIG